MRSVPEFMLRRFGPGAHLVNAISFALLLIAGINLFLLATVVNSLLGWPEWVALIIAAAIVLSHIALQRLDPAAQRDVLPNGLPGVALAGLLASFMAGMAANISAFNTSSATTCGSGT